jgi:RNA 2',3'-cyclic 3'-phosphodiesterase
VGMRAFVAIDVTAPAATAVDAGLPPSPVHLTLRFLGEIDPARLPSIAAAVEGAVASDAPFDLRLEGLGAFPSSAAPRVVWVGVSEGRERVVRLAHRVNASLSAEGLPPEPQAFVPHVTLFHVRAGRDRERARRLLDGTDAPPGPRSVQVREVELKESVLTRGGAVHRTLQRFALSGAHALGG